LPYESLKSVLEVGDSDYLVPADVLTLCRWAQTYYAAPLGEVLNCAASAALLKKQSKKKRSSSPSQSILPPSELTLTPDQVSAIEKLDALRKLPHSVALLHGVTGSGKTEVYIELAKRALSENRGVILLVPEIALTPQLHQRFEQALQLPVALWHSAVAAGKRHQQCLALQQGKIKVIVGARSAVFAPIIDLGLLIVDEEHDSTYKQEDRVRYQARDLAVVRGKITGSLVVLGSATPSFETRERVLEGKYAVATLEKRIAAGGFPRIELLDLKTEEMQDSVQAPLSLKVIRAIQETLDAGEQVIVYLNRRGYAAFLLCQECGEVKECSQCSISLTVHKRASELRCHVCGFRGPIPNQCGKCQGTQLYAMGAGTESLEADLPRFLNGAKIARLDRDQITSATRLNQILEEFRSGSSNLLLGTQMLVKGHDFPGVTLVVVILADALFRWPDFRAPERAYQILKQVSGRAGRGTKAGRVLIQTFDPDHPVLQVIEGRMNEDSFLESERQLRLALGYPPFGRLARLRFESSKREDVVSRSHALTQELKARMPHLDRSNGGGLEFLGPSEAFLERAKGIYRWDLLIKSKEVRTLQQAVHWVRETCYQKKWPVLVDIDPYGI
jgi:primosomal protein N' (replication factor Y)